MQTQVTFKCVQDFIGADEEEGILGTKGTTWFLDKLKRIPDLTLDDDLVQEDWGVVIFAIANRKKFWIGLSMYDAENSWIAHIHHAALFQRMTPSGRDALADLCKTLDLVLKADATVSEIRWYREDEMKNANPKGTGSPTED